ncbi:MAG: recombinase family protein [Pseudomonadota bacterium]
MSNLGYARVSTIEQNLDLQCRALTDAGCVRIFTDHGFSGTERRRPGLHDLMTVLQPGDTLVIWKLDRLARSIHHLLDIVTDLQAREIGFQSLNDAIDTTSATGTLMLHIVGAFAEFERNQLSERTIAGMEAARARGSTIGRPRILSRDEIEEARERVSSGEVSIPQAAKALGVERTTLWRALQN